ncbi:aspartate kinase 3 [Artemisia annua]|uniref:Aspartate kinase 3 n=1 Tax=Artemisia annua TaxID=35608 RepID=A0A2U1KC59_ARTAN|nr:aspartate kinase 3 [Artemisia annua]
MMLASFWSFGGQLQMALKSLCSILKCVTGRISCRGSGFKVVCNAQKVEVLTRSENDIRGLEGVSKELSCVMKLGRSSVASAERMKEVAALILRFPKESSVIVLSAMGKTTNKILLGAEPVPYLNFDEEAELAYFGAQSEIGNN